MMVLITMSFIFSQIRVVLTPLAPRYCHKAFRALRGDTHTQTRFSGHSPIIKLLLQCERNLSPKNIEKKYGSQTSHTHNFHSCVGFIFLLPLSPFLFYLFNQSPFLLFMHVWLIIISVLCFSLAVTICVPGRPCRRCWSGTLSFSCWRCSLSGAWTCCSVSSWKTNTCREETCLAVYQNTKHLCHQLTTTHFF